MAEEGGYFKVTKERFFGRFFFSFQLVIKSFCHYLLSIKAYLENGKVEHFFKVGRQTSKEGIKTPVVTEVCYNYSPDRK